MFKDTKEFKKCWNYFVETYNRYPKELKEWWLSEDQVLYPYHLQTKSFCFCVETFRMWKEFKKTLNPDNIPNSYSYKNKFEWEAEQRQIKKDNQRELEIEKQLVLF